MQKNNKYSPAETAKKALIFYKKNISPLLPPACRFFPTCSVYALEAIDKFGFIKGTVMAFFRFLRCNPFCKGGVDPVPDYFTIRPFAGTKDSKKNAK